MKTKNCWDCPDEGYAVCEGCKRDTIAQVEKRERDWLRGRRRERSRKEVG